MVKRWQECIYAGSKEEVNGMFWVAKEKRGNDDEEEDLSCYTAHGKYRNVCIKTTPEMSFCGSTDVEVVTVDEEFETELLLKPSFNVHNTN